MVQRCPICLSYETLSHKDEILSFCGHCDHMWQTDLTCSVDYTAGYAAATYDSYDGSRAAHTRAGYVAGVSRSIPGSSILDFGFGNGGFLRVMRDMGWETTGVDVHSDHPDIRRHDRSAGSVARYDVITFFDSLEHVVDPALTLKAFEFDRAIVSIPHRPPWFWDLPRVWKHFKPGEHLHYFSSASFVRLFYDLMCSPTCPASHLEDCVRGPLTHGGKLFPNIATHSFKRAPQCILT